MGKGFGIAALVLAILSTLSPYGVNFAVIWIAMICSALAALGGDRGLTIASVTIAGAGLLLFAPVTLGVIWNEWRQGDNAPLFLAFLPMAIPVVALVIVSIHRGKSDTGPINKAKSGGDHDMRKVGGH
jgi:hypothetical protein